MPDHKIYNLASIKRFYEFTESDKNLAMGENLKTSSRLSIMKNHGVHMKNFSNSNWFFINFTTILL